MLKSKPNVKVILPKYSWYEGLLLIQRAFHGIPPNFEEWPLQYWDPICEMSNRLIEYDMKKGII